MNDREIQGKIGEAQLAFRSGRIEQAMGIVGRLEAEHPDHADVLTAKGILLASQGRVEGVDALLASLRIQPNQPEALSWAAFLLLNMQRFDEAEALSRQFAQFAPRNHRAYFLLANSLRGQDRIKEALEAIDKALELNPNDTESMVTKGRLLQAWQMPALAVELYQKAMSIRPTPGAGIELARILMRDSHHEEAIEVLNQIKAAMPAPQRPYNPLAQAYTLLLQFDKAEEQWRLAKKYGDPVQTDQARALVEIAAGRFEVAEGLLFELIEQGKDVAASFSILTTGRKMQASDLPLIERMAVAAESDEAPPGLSIELNYALGKSYDDVRDYEKAMHFYDRANEICRELYRDKRAFDPEERRRFNDFVISITTPERLAKLKRQGLDSDMPLFVVGMIRSGTTLTETILSGHSQIAGAGEQGFWTERVIDFIVREGEEMKYDHATVMQFARQYLADLNPGDPTIRYVIDKNPGNIDLAGILHGAFPRAKFVHLKRHPVDNLLSIWMTPLHANARYANDRAHLVFTYKEYLRLAKHWEAVIPCENFQTYRYEDLTREPRATISLMLEFLDLPLEDACFAPEKNKRSVLTPSVYQVRQAIHTGSQQRWKNYQPWLREFAELLPE